MRDNSVVESFPGEDQRKCRARWLAVLIWAIFGVGLLVQAFSPGLRIEHNKFVAPGTISKGQEIHPDEIIARERTVQLLSATLTLGGALGLAVCYGPALFRRRES
ncbi:MAG: hypothetical protein ACLQU2_09865 [Candidatus Binataceae bacterium]